MPGLLAPNLTWSDGHGPEAVQRFAEGLTLQSLRPEFAAPASAMPLSTPSAQAPAVQRTPEPARHEAIGQFSETTINRVENVPAPNESATVDLEVITEHVWGEIRRRLRVERERSRGVM